MAVQAQYPSNVLLLNRTVQEGKSPLANDYSLQPQPGGIGSGGVAGAFLDQTHVLFNSGGANPRKRGRELTPSTMNRSLMTMQPHQPQLIDLTQLHHNPNTNQNPNPNHNIVSTGLRLAFGEQQQTQNSLSSQSSSLLFSVLAEDLAAHVKQQRDEIDNFLNVQAEQLRRGLEEKRQRQYRELLGAAEESAARRLREKEAEVEKAARKNAQLEARAAQLSAEAQAWQARARAQEVTAATLQAQLQQAMMSGGGAGGCSAHLLQDRDDGNGIGCAGGEAEDAESAYIDPDRVMVSTGPSCKACRKRVASVVLLPCRHLCLCTECDAVAQACPLCLSIRASSLEVFLC